MNKTLTTAGAALSASSYVSPETKVTEIHTEGLLCVSNLHLMKGSQLEEWDDEIDLTW